MKKIIQITFTFFLLSAAQLSAQNFSVTPATYDTVFAPFNESSEFDLYPQNLLPTPILFKWERIAVNLPVGWDFQFCDNANCFTGMPVSGEMDPVAPGGQGLLSVHLFPYAVYGQGTVQLYVYDDGFYNDGDTVTWLITAGPVGVEENETGHFILYPSVARTQVTARLFSKVAHASIFDETGKQVAAYHSMPLNPEGEFVFEVSGLPAGIYALMISSPERSFVQKFIRE